MFTGIVEEVGRVAKIEPLGDSLRIKISCKRVVEDAALGDSISVNGVCLTVAELPEHRDWFAADVMQESLDKSALGSLEENSPVNLERAMSASTRFGGHIVQGHVDGVSELLNRTSSENWDVLRFSLPSSLARYVVSKGSIAVSGTSLTVSNIGEDWFEVSLIPTTLKETILGELEKGELVNLEVDVLAKYVEKMMQPHIEVANAHPGNKAD